MVERKIVVGDVLPLMIEQSLIGITRTCRRHDEYLDAVWSCLRWSLFTLWMEVCKTEERYHGFVSFFGCFNQELAEPARVPLLIVLETNSKSGIVMWMFPERITKAAWGRQ